MKRCYGCRQVLVRPKHLAGRAELCHACRNKGKEEV